MRHTTNEPEFDECVLHLVQDLRHLLGSEELKFESDCCALKIQDVLVNMQLDPANGRLILSAYLAELPKIADRLLLEQLLIGNLYWKMGATICLEPGSRSVLMLLSEPLADLTAPHLLSVLQQFAEDVSEARRQLQAYKDKPRPHGRF